MKRRWKRIIKTRQKFQFELVLGVIALAATIFTAYLYIANAGGNDIVSIANSQVGYAESPIGSNCTKYGPCQEWCADFVSWVYKQAGQQFYFSEGQYGTDNGTNWQLANAFSIENYLVDHGKWHSGVDSSHYPSPGDVLVTRGQGGAGHVGIVTSVNVGTQTIYTADGNFSDHVVATNYTFGYVNDFGREPSGYGRVAGFARGFAAEPDTYGRIHAIATDISTDNIIDRYQTTASTQSWSSLANLGGATKYRPSIARNQDGRLEIFITGTNGDLYHKWATCATCGWTTSWADMGGNDNYSLCSNGSCHPAAWNSGPAVVRNAQSELEVFIRSSVDNTLYHAWQSSPGGGFTPWYKLGSNNVSSNSAVARNKDGRMEVFYRGSDLALWHLWENSDGTWSGPTRIGGTLTSSPAATTDPQGRIWVFVKANNNSIDYIYQTSPGQAFTGWKSLGGGLLVDPGVSVNTNGEIEVFAIGYGHTSYQNHQTCSGCDSWSGWGRY